MHACLLCVYNAVVLMPVRVWALVGVGGDVGTGGRRYRRRHFVWREGLEG